MRRRARLFEPAFAGQAGRRANRSIVDRKGSRDGRFTVGKGTAGDRRRNVRHRFNSGFGGAGDGGVAALLEPAQVAVTGNRTGEAREERGEEQQQLHAKTR